VRGGIVDTFPASEAHPIRLEFVGDTVESLRRYDPATQRSTESIDQMDIVPLQDVLDADDRSATVLDYLALAGHHRLVVSERDEVDAQAVKLIEQFHQSYEEAVQRKERAPAPAQLFADWDVVAARLDQATHLVTLGLDDDAPADGPVEQDGAPTRAIGALP